MTLEVEPLTPPGPGAVAVVLVRGPEALSRVAALAGGRAPRAGRATLLVLADAEGPLDEALAVVHGDDRVELHLHGSLPIVQRVCAALADAPPPQGPGGPPGGEGLCRGLEERAWRALAGAPCEAAARVLLDQAEGALRGALERLIEAAPAERVAGARSLAALGRRLEPLFAPARVVLAGPVNAGKSTLFNALVGGSRVIVSAEPGTTRDRIVERARLGAYAVDLCDTAGERGVGGAAPRSIVPEGGTVHGEGAAELERRGQELARAERAAADLVLWLEPSDGSGVPGPPLEGERRVVLASRGDLGGSSPWPVLAALSDPEGARRVVEEAFLGALELPRRPWVPARPVPFEPGLWLALEEALETGPAAVLATLRALLAEGSTRTGRDPGR